jgi:pyroglutamyl-peptidase
VDLEKLRVRLSKDLEQGFDAVLLLGQSPSASDIHLESLAVNIAGVQYNSGRLYGPLEHGGPAAYQSRMPIDRLRDALDREGVTASISYHAGTYLCNAIFYLTEHWHRQRGRDCQVGFAHFPLTTEQVRAEGREFGGVSRLDLAKGIAIMIEELRRGQGNSGGSGGESSWGYWAMGESANGMENPLA